MFARQFRVLIASFALLTVATATSSAVSVNPNPSLRDLQQIEDAVRRAQQKQSLESMKKADRQEKTLPQTKPAKVGKGIEFFLTGIVHSPSQVLTDEEIQAAVEPFVRKKVASSDLAAILDAINQLYRAKGYVVCQAALRPQRISGGVLTVTLIEGKTEVVLVQGNDTTDEDYIKEAFHLSVGEVANYRDMYNDLVRFNMTNDVQLTVNIRAGDAPETTAYELTAHEPDRWSVTAFADTIGSDSTGRYRGAVSVVNRSVFGFRDNMYLMGIASEGSHNVLWGYNVPLNSQGARLSLSASAGWVEVVEGPNEPFDVDGKSFIGSVRLSHPFVATSTNKLTAFTQYSYETSSTDMYDGVRVADSQIDKAGIGFDWQHVGEGWVVLVSNTVSEHKAKEFIFETAYDYWVLSGNAYAEALITDNISTSATAAWQVRLGGDDMISSDQFYIGHSSGVRGYPNNFLASDNGFWVNWEAAWQVTSWLKPFVFADFGRLAGFSSYSDRKLYSVGFGLEGKADTWGVMRVTAAFPLERDFESLDKPDSVRWDATVSLTY